MKKILILILFPLLAHSQIEFGAKGGTTVSINEIDDNALPNSSSGVGFYAGAFAEHKFGNFYLETDLQYILNRSTGSVNYRQSGNSNGYPNRLDMKSNISMLNFYIYGKCKVLKFLDVKAGFYASYLTTTKYEAWSGNKDFFKIERDFDLGTSIGAEIKLYAGLFAEVTYDYAFNNILSNKSFDEYDPIVQSSVSNTDYRLRTLKVGLGYKL